jgi:hypothetical protein
MHYLYKYEYGTSKPVEIIVRGIKHKENNGEDEPIQSIRERERNDTVKLPI